MSSNYSRYINVVRDRNGNAIQGAQLYVYIGDSTRLALLYDGSGNEAGQPLSTDQDGIIRNGATGDDGLGFRVRGGRYRIEGSAGGVNLVTMPDVLIGTGQGYDVDQLQALANDGVFQSESDGLNETGDGDFFWVPGPDSLQLYRNNQGAAEEQDEYPNLQLVENIRSDSESARDDAQAARDDAQESASIATGAESESLGYRNEIEGYRGDTLEYRNEAKDFRDEASQIATGDFINDDTQSDVLVWSSSKTADEIRRAKSEAINATADPMLMSLLF